jgi:hypothetical protein
VVIEEDLGDLVFPVTTKEEEEVSTDVCPVEEVEVELFWVVPVTIKGEG